MLSILLISSITISTYTIREIDNNILWINVPVDVNELKQFMTPELKPSTYNNFGWILVKVYNVASIKSSALGSLGVWIDMPFSTGLTATFSILVETNFGEKGYLLLSYDANSGITGTIRTLSCLNYQIGVKCETAKTITLDSKNLVWVSKNNDFMKLSYQIKDKNEDSNFVDFILNRQHKFTKNSLNETFVNYQKEKENPNNKILKSIEVNNFSSNIITKKLGLNEKFDKEICKDNTCFWSNFYQLDDEELVEYRNRIPLMFYNS